MMEKGADKEKPFIQYLCGIKSMRQTIKEIEVYVAYRMSMPILK